MESLRARAVSSRESRATTSSIVRGGAAAVASLSVSGPKGIPLERRRFSALWRDFFSSQRRSQGYFSRRWRQRPALGRTVQSARVKVPRLKLAITVSPLVRTPHNQSFPLLERIVDDMMLANRFALAVCIKPQTTVPMKTQCQKKNTGQGTLTCLR